jgi:hypothetical protein
MIGGLTHFLYARIGAFMLENYNGKSCYIDSVMKLPSILDGSRGAGLYLKRTVGPGSML